MAAFQVFNGSEAGWRIALCTYAQPQNSRSQTVILTVMLPTRAGAGQAKPIPGRAR